MPIIIVRAAVFASCKAEVKLIALSDFSLISLASLEI